MNEIQYYCTAERCIWRVWTSKTRWFCKKRRCPYLEMRQKKEQNGNVSTKNVTESEIAFEKAISLVGTSTNEAAEAFERLAKTLKKNGGVAL